MSQYIHVFVRCNDEFVELFCYGRNSEFYRVMKDCAPWEKIARLTHEQIREARADLIGEIEAYKSNIAENSRMISVISNWNNSIEDKLKIINKYQEGIDETKQDMDEARDTLNMLTVLLNVEAELYIGEECGRDVSVKDIVEPR